jgi:predicted nucleic acid-binding protein
VYLLDTNVVSELRSVPDADLHVSVVTLAEIQAGIELTRDQDPDKARAIEAWLDQLEQAWNVLPMDAAIFRLWARLMHRRSDTLYEDAMIAASARVHRLVVVTRNVADFADFGVEVLNPFDTRAP